MSEEHTKQLVHENTPKIERLIKGWRLYVSLMVLSGLCVGIGVGLNVRGPAAVILYSLSRLFFMPIPIRLRPYRRNDMANFSDADRRDECQCKMQTTTRSTDRI